VKRVENNLEENIVMLSTCMLENKILKPMLTGDNRPQTIRFEDIDLKKYHFEMVNSRISENKPVIECELYVGYFDLYKGPTRLYKTHYEISALLIMSNPKYDSRMMEIHVRDFLTDHGLRML
jgi:hypothetical protein